MSSVSATDVGGDLSSSTTSNNPVKTDGELQVLMQKLDSIRKYSSFHLWKGKFLTRFEKFLYDDGMTPAQDSASRLQDSLERLVKKTQKVLDHIHEGHLSETKKTVKASLALQEMCNDLEKIRGSMASDVIPSLKSDERTMGYSKFHLGAVLIRQGFQQYSVMKAIEEAVTEIDAKLQNVADRQQHDLFAQYHTQVERFCDVMADLNLYDIMLKCVQFQNPPGDDESEEPETIRIVLHYVEDGRRMQIEVEETEVMQAIQSTAQIAFGLHERPLVIKHQGRSVSGCESDCGINDKTLQQLDIDDDAVLDVELLLIPITVHNTWDDTQIELCVEPLSYVSDLKQLLEAKSNIPAINQNLTLKDQSINDVTKTLKDYQVVAGAVLELQPKGVKITVSRHDGITHEIEVAPSDDVRGIKQEIEDAGGMVMPRQVLKYSNGKELPTDGSSVKAMGIRDGTIIFVDVLKVPITANCWDGNQIELTVDPAETLSFLKNQLENDSEIPANNQNIIFNDVTLEDDAQVLQDYGIKAGSVVDLEPFIVSLSVRIPDGTAHEIQVSPSDKSSDIKQRIEKVSGISVDRQVLKDRDGIELPNDGSTIRDLGLRQQEELSIDIFKVPVKVSSWDGTLLETMVDPSVALVDFKQHLERSSGIQVDNQALFLDDEELQDDASILKDIGLKSESVFRLEPKTLKISVVMPNGVTQAIEIAPSDHCGILKEKIQRTSGMTIPRQVLKFRNGNEVPNDGSTVKDLGIRDGDVVAVDVFKIPVNIRSWDGQVYEVMLDPTEKVEEVKQYLEGGLNIASNNLRIFYDNAELQDDQKPVEAFGVTSGSCLDVEPKTITVSVATPSGASIELRISPSENCQTIKEIVHDRTGISVVRQVLLDDKGHEFPDDESRIRDIGIRDGGSFMVEIFKIPVVVQSWGGLKYEIMADPTEELLELKKLLEGDSGIPVDNQSLHFDNVELLDNAKTMQDYGIGDGSVLQVEPIFVKVSVTTPDDVEHEIEVSPRDDVNAVKIIIEKTSGITVPRQILRYQSGDQLSNGGMTVADMGIRDGTKLTVGIFTFPIDVIAWDGKRFEVVVDPTEALHELKKLCEVETGIPVANQNIFHLDEALTDDGMSLHSYGIEPQSILNLEPKSIVLVVNTPDGMSSEIEVPPTATSKAVKEAIQDSTGMKFTRQVLKDIAGNELPEDGSSVKDMGLRDGSTVTVEIFMIPVTVESWDGNQFQLMIDPAELLSSLKQSLEVKADILAKNQILHFDKTPLDNDTKALEDYGLQSNSVLSLEPKSINVLVDTPDGKTHKIEISPLSDSSTIKLKIQGESGILVPRQILRDSKGNELPQDGSTVKNMGIRNGDTLNVDTLKIPIVIGCWDGTQREVMVDPFEALSALMEMIQDSFGIRPDNQRIFLGVDILDNDTKVIDDYGIQSGSVLSLEPKSVNISVVTPNGDVHDVAITPSDDTNKIKQKIHAKSFITVCRQVLVDNNGKQLPPEGATVKEMGIRDGDSLIVEIFTIPISVKCWDSMQFDLIVDPTEHLSDLREQLEADSGIAAENQNLLLVDKILRDECKSLYEHGIAAGSVVNLEPKNIRVTVAVSNGTVYDINVSPADDTVAVKQKFEDASGMAVSRQVLKDIDGIELPSDGSSVKDMGIRDGTSLLAEVFKVPLIVKTWDNRHLDVMVDPTEALSELKLQLEAVSGIQIANQNLMFGDETLDDDAKHLDDWGIKAEQILHLEPKTIRMAVYTPDGVSHSVEVAPGDDTGAIKRKVQESTGILACRQVLRDQAGKELTSDGCTVKQMGLRDGNILSIELFTIAISVASWDGSHYDIKVDPTESLASLKELLVAESGIHAKNQIISFRDVALGEDSTNLLDYGVAEGAKLYLEPRFVKLEVTAPDGEKHEITVRPSEKSIEMKHRVQEVTGIAVPRQVLKHDGHELTQDGATVKDIGLRDGDALSVDIFMVPVTVKSWDGRQYELSVDPSQGVLNFKQQVEADTALPAKNQRLSLGKEELLEDNKALQDYGLKAESILELEPKHVKLVVTTPEGATHHIEVSPSDDTKAIKQAIQNETGILIARQVVCHDGHELSSDASTVKDMGLREADNLAISIFQITVTVESWDGTHYNLTVDPTDPLAIFRQQLEVELMVPVNNQNIQLEGEKLQENTKTLQEYDVKPGSLLYLEPKVVHVEVTTPDGVTHTIGVSPTDNTITISQMIEAKTGITIPRQVLTYNGRDLSGNDGYAPSTTVKDMGIREGSALCVEIFTIPVTVQAWDGTQYELNVDPTETLSDFKKELHILSGIPASNQNLSLLLDEALLLSEETSALHDHGIEAGSILQLEPNTVKVAVVTPDGVTHDINLTLSDGSTTIKQKIQETTGMAVPRQVLKFNGTELLCGTASTIKDMGIREGSALLVEIFKVPITIQTKDGQVFKLMLDPTITGGDIKRYLELKTGNPLRYQILHFGPVKLADDSKTAGAYGIVGGSVLHLDRLDDPIVFVDVKCGTLFSVNRDEVIERGVLTPISQDGNTAGVDVYLEAVHDSNEKDRMLKAILGSPNLGVKPQIVVEKIEVEDYDLEEAENVKNKWGVQLRKTQKNRRGSEFFFVDIKTGHVGVLDRMSMIDKKFITPLGFGKSETLEEGEKDAQRYDRYVKEIRKIFHVASL